MKKIKLFVLALSVLVSTKSFAQKPVWDDGQAQLWKGATASTPATTNQINFLATMNKDQKGFTLFDGTAALCSWQLTVFPENGTKDVSCSANYTVNLYKGTDTLGFDYYGFQLRYKGYKNEKENVLAYAKIQLSTKTEKKREKAPLKQPKYDGWQG